MSREAMRRAACDAVVDVFAADERVAIALAEISADLFARRSARPAARRQRRDHGADDGRRRCRLRARGFRPVAHTITPFLTERALEQIKLDFGYQRLEGLFVSTGASYDYGTSGMTHHGPGDVAALATVPGAEVVVPGTAGEADALVRSTYANGRPTYLRTTVAENSASRPLALRGLDVVRRGDEVTVIAVGPMLDRTLAALDGLDATVLYATTVVPLDAATLAAESAAAPEVIVVEPFYEGTLTAQVASALVHRPTRILSIGVPRQVISRYGSREQHDRALGLDSRGIRERLRAFVDGSARRAA